MPNNTLSSRRIGKGLQAVPIISAGPVYKIAISARLRDLAREMMSIGSDMEYHGGFSTKLTRHGRELYGAGMIVEGWAAEIAATVDDDGENK